MHGHMNVKFIKLCLPYMYRLVALRLFDNYP